MGGITRIFSKSRSAENYIYEDVNPSQLVWFPEIKYTRVAAGPRPVHPADQIELCPKMVGKTVVTLSEFVILWFLREVREGRMVPDSVELYCDGKRILIDMDGELIDRWPEGFYRDRADLLFGSGE